MPAIGSNRQVIYISKTKINQQKLKNNLSPILADTNKTNREVVIAKILLLKIFKFK